MSARGRAHHMQNASLNNWDIVLFSWGTLPGVPTPKNSKGESPLQHKEQGDLHQGDLGFDTAMEEAVHFIWRGRGLVGSASEALSCLQ